MDDPILDIRRLLQSGTQTEVAKHLGVSPQYLSDVLKERRAPGKKILEGLGLKRQVQYVRIKR